MSPLIIKSEKDAVKLRSGPPIRADRFANPLLRMFTISPSHRITSPDLIKNLSVLPQVSLH
jgi:hypothetical protein